MGVILALFYRVQADAVGRKVPRRKNSGRSDSRRNATRLGLYYWVNHDGCREKLYLGLLDGRGFDRLGPTLIG